MQFPTKKIWGKTDKKRESYDRFTMMHFQQNVIYEKLKKLVRICNKNYRFCTGFHFSCCKLYTYNLQQRMVVLGSKYKALGEFKLVQDL